MTIKERAQAMKEIEQLEQKGILTGGSAGKAAALKQKVFSSPLHLRKIRGKDFQQLLNPLVKDAVKADWLDEFEAASLLMDIAANAGFEIGFNGIEER